MKSTILSKNGGYSVQYFTRKNAIATHSERFARVFDGDALLMVARVRTLSDYLEESVDNECFEACEIFKTIKGNYFIYWRDNEIDFDYITKIEEV